MNQSWWLCWNQWEQFVAALGRTQGLSDLYFKNFWVFFTFFPSVHTLPTSRGNSNFLSCTSSSKCNSSLFWEPRNPVVGKQGNIFLPLLYSFSSSIKIFPFNIIVDNIRQAWNPFHGRKSKSCSNRTEHSQGWCCDQPFAFSVLQVENACKDLPEVTQQGRNSTYNISEWFELFPQQLCALWVWEMRSSYSINALPWHPTSLPVSPATFLDFTAVPGLKKCTDSTRIVNENRV